MSVHPYFRLVYVSSPVQIDEKLLYSEKITRDNAIARPFIFPVGIIKRSEDVIDIGAHLSDARAFIFKMKGLKALLKRIIVTDQVVGDVEKDQQLLTPLTPLHFRKIHFYAATDLSSYLKLTVNLPTLVANDALYSEN